VARTLVIPERESERAYLDENGSRSLTSRRGFLKGSAAALAGGALMAVSGVVIAKGNGDDKDKKQGARETTAASPAWTSSTTPSF
jgi:hypothetical protein